MSNYKSRPQHQWAQEADEFWAHARRKPTAWPPNALAIICAGVIFGVFIAWVVAQW